MVASTIRKSKSKKTVRKPTLPRGAKTAKPNARRAKQTVKPNTTRSKKTAKPNATRSKKTVSVSRTASTRSRKKTPILTPTEPDFGMRFVGYEDDQRVRRIFAVLPISMWHTPEIAFYQTTGSSNAGFDVYRGSWVPTICVLNSPIPELMLDTGHLVKMGHVNDVLKTRHVPEWLIHWVIQHHYFGLARFIEKPLIEIQSEIQGIRSVEVANRHIEEVKSFDRVYKFLESYFLTWEQVQVSAQFPPEGFWHSYPDLRAFALSHQWDRENRAFVRLPHPLPTLELPTQNVLESMVYGDAKELNAQLAKYDAYLDANEGYQYYRDRRPEMAALNAMYPPPAKEWHVVTRKIDGLHLYLETVAIHLKIVASVKERVFS